MKGTISFIILSVVLSSIVLADGDSATVYTSISSNEPINSEVVLNSNSTITNSIYCNGAACNMNVGGNIVTTIHGNQTFNFNQYTTQVVTGGGSGGAGGLSLGELGGQLANVAGNYYNGVVSSSNDDAMNLWTLLGQMFVTRKEYIGTYANVEYLANEVDTLKAQNDLLLSYLNVTLNATTLECQTLINKAHRTGMRYNTTDDRIVDINTFGDTCAKVIGVG